MAGKGSTMAYHVLRLALNGVARTGMSATAGTTVLYARLHTADPATGTGTLNECNYTGYAPVVTQRSSLANGWSCSTPTSGNSSASPVTAITFGQMTGGSTQTATHFSLTTSTQADEIWYSGTISPTIAIQTNVTPILTTASSITED